LLIKNGLFPSEVLRGERISEAVKTIAFPGLRTGVGRVSLKVCARQLRAAIDDVILARNGFPVTWVDAQLRHQKLYTDRVRELQFPS